MRGGHLAQFPTIRAGFIDPMLLQRSDHLAEGPGWLYELKLDGYRPIGARVEGRVLLWSRNENDFSRRYPSIAGALSKLPENTVVDGEIVALHENGRPSFDALQNYGSSQGGLVYYLFDVPVPKGHDLRNQPLARKQWLDEEVLPNLFEPIRASPALPGTLKELIAVKEHGLEGLVAKRRDSRYEPGERSGAWMKMRMNEGQEFVINRRVYCRRHDLRCPCIRLLRRAAIDVRGPHAKRVHSFATRNIRAQIPGT
jgi:ATP-dependent DNA ligase